MIVFLRHFLHKALPCITPDNLMIAKRANGIILVYHFVEISTSYYLKVFRYSLIYVVLTIFTIFYIELILFYQILFVIIDRIISILV